MEFEKLKGKQPQELSLGLTLRVEVRHPTRVK